jgi:23S rRNA (cytidine2498-2'-O)-methyltransferase
VEELVHLGLPQSAQKNYDDLITGPGKLLSPVWAKNTWPHLIEIQFGSISDASKQLKNLGLRWSHYPHKNHRKAELISQSLKIASNEPLAFPFKNPPNKPIGSFTLISSDLILASNQCPQRFSQGDLKFIEDTDSPPSRAYLKLWEFFSRTNTLPLPGSSCIDLGSCPGGWTWVLARLGAQVVSVDRAPIDPRVAKMPEVTFLQGNAFTLDPTQFEKMDWVFSDVICEPPRLLELVQKWIQVFPNANFACSVKFKGKTDFETLEQLLKITDSRVMHLCHNKNEFTWYRLVGRSSSP